MLGGRGCLFPLSAGAVAVFVVVDGEECVWSLLPSGRSAFG